MNGDTSLSLVQAPTRVPAGQSATMTIRFAGAASQTIANASLSVQLGATTLTAEVYAVAGAPDIPAASWETVVLPGDQPCGQGLSISLPTAPFPHSSASYTDDTVRIFVPEGLRDIGAQDLVVHFHGHYATVSQTLAAHRYQQHLCASGVNAVLVVPQGPVDAPSSNFGKLMDPGGLAALVQQVLVVLYRGQRIVSRSRP